MKKKTIFLVSGTLALVAFVLCSFTTDVKSFTELSAKAGGYYCIPAPGYDCVSRETGNVYAGYREGPDETTEEVN